MARSKRVRWECPNGLHPAVLGSTRPLRDASVRFCLECSAESPRLVERVAPALERKREVAAARTQQRQQTKAQREREAARRRRFARCLEPDGSAGEVDVKRTIGRMLKLPAIVAALRDDDREWLLVCDVDFTLWHATGRGCSGRAWPAIEIHLTVGPWCPRAQVEELILHELVHYLLPSRTAHGQRFRSVLMAAAREWFPGVRPVWAGHVYKMDAQIWREAWRLAQGVPGDYVDYADDDKVGGGSDG